MTPELGYLFYTAIVAFLLVMVPMVPMMMKLGPIKLSSNRDDMPDPDAFTARAMRARDNCAETLAIFAVVVVVANLAGVSNDMTILGAQLFFYGRVVAAGSYLAGIVMVRTVAWAVSMVGLVMIALQLI